MTLNFFKKLVLTLGIGSLLFVSVDTLITKPNNDKNTTSVIGHFKYIQRQVVRGDTSYNLYIDENKHFYKIIPEWSGCFRYETFNNELKEGQIIQILFRKNNGLRSASMPIIVSILVNNKDYLNRDCINNQMHDSKIEIPAICLGSIVLLGLIFYFKEKNIARD